MSRSPGSIDDRKKQAVLEATLQLRIDHGDRFSISQVARRAGVSRQTIYNRFGGKHGLLRAFADAARLPCPICPPLSGELETALAAYAERLLRWSRDPRRTATVGLSFGRPGHGGFMSDGFDAAATVLSERLRQSAGLPRRSAPSPSLAARLFLNLVLGAQAHEPGAGFTDDDVVRQARAAAALFVRGYASERASARPDIADALQPPPAAPARGDVARALTPEETSP